MKNLILPSLIVFLVGCGSSIKKADIPATADPATETAQLEKEIQNGYAAQYDVLAHDDFKKAEEYTNKARKSIGSRRDQGDILDDLRYGRAYFNRAAYQANQRRQSVEGIIKARQNALNAGARQFSDSRKTLEKLDKKMHKASDNFAKNLSPVDYSNQQQGYMDLELTAIQNTQLSQANSMINGAMDRRAARYTPKILAEAQKSLRIAVNAIATDRHNPNSFKEAVEKANDDAALLVEVLSNTKQGDDRIGEAAATRIALANRQVQSLSTELETARNEMGEQSAAMRNVSAKMRLQTAIENARKSIDPDQAEAFQQGDRLLIRLKAMNFSSSRSELPPPSLALLSKVKNIVTELQPSEIVVTGHTDSTGSARLNDRLSRERAEAVAEYLKTAGLDENVKIKVDGKGFRQPIANNKTREGRAQNRRVDIAVVPAAADEMEVDLRRARDSQSQDTVY